MATGTPGVPEQWTRVCVRYSGVRDKKELNVSGPAELEPSSNWSRIIETDELVIHSWNGHQVGTYIQFVIYQKEK